MLKTLVTASAMVALLAAAPAVAQNGGQPLNSGTTDQPTPDTAPLPLKPDVGTPAPTGDNQAAAPAKTDNNQAAAPAETGNQVAATDKFIAQQDENQVLASSYLNATVYNAAGDNVGSVNDIILDKDGKMTAVVIGVGGFLGIGQKNIAVSMDALDRATDENGNPKLVLNASDDEIDQAPAFMTLADLKAKQQQDMQPQPPAGGALAPAPAAPASPTTTQ